MRKSACKKKTGLDIKQGQIQIVFIPSAGSAGISHILKVILNLRILFEWYSMKRVHSIHLGQIYFELNRKLGLSVFTHCARRSRRSKHSLIGLTSFIFLLLLVFALFLVKTTRNMHDIYERFTLRENFYANQENTELVGSCSRR